MWNLISSLTQSNENFRIDATFTLQITFVNVPIGSGARRKNKLTIDFVTQRSIVSIMTENLCLPRALVVGEVYLKTRATDSDHVREEWRVSRDGRRQLQRERLITKANVQIPRNGCVFNEIVKFQKYFL